MRQSPQPENYQRVVRFILLTLFVFFGHVVSAQSDLKVRGTILDSNGEHLSSVNIVIKGTTHEIVPIWIETQFKYGLQNQFFSFVRFRN